MRKYKTLKTMSAGERKTVHDGLQEQFHRNPESISGYCSLFWAPGDIYLSDRVSHDVRYREEFRMFVDDCIRRFAKMDCGEVTCGTILDANADCLITPGKGPEYACYTYGRDETNGNRGRERIKIRALRYFTFVSFEYEYDLDYFITVDQAKKTNTF